MTDKQVRMTKKAADNLNKLVAQDEEEKSGKSIVSGLINKEARRVLK